MVVTPDHRPLDPTAPLSPLLLAQRPPTSPGLIPVSSSTSLNQGIPPLRKNSTGSFSKLSEFWLDGTPSAPGTPWEAPPAPNANMPHVGLSIDASEWRHPVFKTKVLQILRRLKVPLWTHPSLTPNSIHLQKVSGAMTNAVFFVSFNPNPKPTSPSMSPLLTPTMPPTDPDHPPALLEDQFPQTLLLRIYGPSSDMLISRDEELRILHVLSSVYNFGPKVFGTFMNGRVEQFFPSRALTAKEMRVDDIACGIARRMRELHSVDLRLLGYQQGREGEPMVWRSISEWLNLAGESLNNYAALGGRWEMWVENIKFHKLRQEFEAYRQWVTENPARGKGVVFSHNDAQYGNLLLLDQPIPKGVPEHHKYIVIDFEYAAPNPRGFDIANHFHEWCANYHHPTLSHSLKPHYGYPTLEQRQHWYRSYLSVEMSAGEQKIIGQEEVPQAKVDALEQETRIWSPASSAFWALWGITMAEDQVRGMCESKDFVPDFDYLSYAVERLEMFREEAAGLGVPMP